MNSGPGVIVGLSASVIVLVAQQVASSGIVSSAGAIQVRGLEVAIVPLIASLIIRQFVTPVGPNPPAA